MLFLNGSTVMFTLKRKTNNEITVAFSFWFVYKGALYKDVCPVICFDVTVHKNAYIIHIYAWNILGFSYTTKHNDSFVVRYLYVFNVRCYLCVIAILYTMYFRHGSIFSYNFKLFILSYFFFLCQWGFNVRSSFCFVHFQFHLKIFESNWKEQKMFDFFVSASAHLF